jgi:hypothetical protein
MTTPAPKASAGNMATFNILHGFPEALVRGMRSSFLADADYHHLTQCETLDDIRLNLAETDYGDVLADSNSITPNQLQKAAVEKVRIRKDRERARCRLANTVTTASLGAASKQQTRGFFWSKCTNTTFLAYQITLCPSSCTVTMIRYFFYHRISKGESQLFIIIFLSFSNLTFVIYLLHRIARH